MTQTDTTVGSVLDRLIADAEESSEITSEPQAKPVSKSVSYTTGLPARYRDEWPRPESDEWQRPFEKIIEKSNNGGIIGLIGPRGTGKTRFAAEAIRDISPEAATYTTAMQLFLRLRASYGKKAAESEDEIVNEMSRARLLVLDEVQERGNTAWEDRILTHILDRRYGAMKPTILIANLTESALIECLGDSIVSRLKETGGIIEVNGAVYR